MTEEQIQIALPNGKVVEVLGIRLGDLAVTPSHPPTATKRWTITHLSSGFTMGGFYFEAKASAIAAMEELSTLRNSWDISIEKMRAEGPKIMEILKKHGAERKDGPTATPTYRNNGYEGDPL